MRAPNALPTAALATALLLGSSAAAAQEAPPPAAPAAVDREVQIAVHLLRMRQTEDAAAVLARLAQQRSVDVRGYDTVAVLFRLANGRARPGMPTAGVLPPEPAPAASAGPEALPPPPSDELARSRIIDGAVERLARWDEAGARGLLDGAFDEATAASPAGPTLRALRQVAQGGVAVGAASLAPPMFERPGQLLPDRPAGTIEGFEVLSLYVATASYGLMLGTWAGLAATDDSRNALRVALPLTGLTAGLAAAIVLDRSREVRRGRGYAVNAGFVLGSLAGTGALIYADPDETRDGWGIAAAGATLGIGAAVGLAHAVDALPGTVNWVTTAGMWGSVVGIALSLATDTRARNESVGSGLLIGEGVGVVLAMLTADALKPTPAQTRWTDVGCLLGGLLGGSLGAGSESTSATGIGMAVGVLAGGAIGWFVASPSEADRASYLQRNAARSLPLRFGVAPLRGGGMLTVGM